MFGYLGLEHFFDSSKRVYWIYLFSALLFAVLFFWRQTAVLKKQFSAQVLWHPSARLDYIYFIVVSLVKTLLLIPLLIGVNDVALWMVLQMQDTFGYMERTRVSRVWLLAGYTLTLFVLNDFTRYVLHRLMHAVPLLWRFHRVHHSAEVLNPLTFYRIHPVENLLFGLRYAFTTGFVTAVFIYFFGAGIGLVEVLGVNVLVFVFMIFGSNLRHSHIPLSYGKRLEKWFISPLQHQLHHTRIYTHRNFGSYLAIWDRWFGTLTLGARAGIGKIKSKKALDFGLPITEAEKTTHSLLGAFLNPFYKGIKL